MYKHNDVIRTSPGRQLDTLGLISPSATVFLPYTQSSTIFHTKIRRGATDFGTENRRGATDFLYVVFE